MSKAMKNGNKAPILGVEPPKVDGFLLRRTQPLSLSRRTLLECLEPLPPIA
jgi:hypothetical protein